MNNIPRKQQECIIVSYDSRYCKKKLHDTSRSSLGLVLGYTLQHTATNCDTLQHTATHSYPLISGAASGLSFATHCNTHQCSAMLPSPHASEVASGVASCSCSGLRAKLHACMHTYKLHDFLYIYMYTYVYMYIYVYVYIYTYVCICVH